VISNFLSVNRVTLASNDVHFLCGKKMSKETTDTLGNQKQTNYALRADMTKEEFKKELLTGLTTPPGYFPQNVLMNIKGYDSIDDAMVRGKKPLSPDAFEAAANETGAFILDTRGADDFAAGFVPNSINIGIDWNFAQWVGEMIPDVKQQILLVCDKGIEVEAITRLARVGYDFSIGYLDGGFESWKNAGKEVDTFERITAEQMADKMKDGSYKIFDVRKASEFDSEHVVGAENVPLNEINDHLSAFPSEQPFAIHCAGGYRSMIAASILKARGWDNFVDVKGGFGEIKDTDVDVTDYVCPTTLL
jgi:rhodanese-related sulfurtransferase